jgi:hypothetical protein
MARSIWVGMSSSSWVLCNDGFPLQIAIIYSHPNSCIAYWVVSTSHFLLFQLFIMDSQEFTKKCMGRSHVPCTEPPTVLRTLHKEDSVHPGKVT